MNKKEFLGRLSELIKDISEEEKEDILFDYEEHFRIGLEKGRKEEEIAASLGDPKVIAKQSRASCILKEAEKTTSVNNIMRAIFAAVGLGFFNLVIVLGPAIGLIGILVALFAVAFAITVSGAAVLFGTLMGPVFAWNMYIPFAAVVSIPLGIGLTALGLLTIIGAFYLAKFFYKLSISYLKMNFNIFFIG
ncbi:unnamed protein product [marine sediment metagenome]|uniref:DUF1700 domain-containing protein n=1 Tax=marine sediment metagenome TaxID=412755 RepID=X1BST0_9ZZZZ